MSKGAGSGRSGRGLPLLCLVTTALLALAVHYGFAEPFDRALLLASAPPPAVVPLASAVTWLGDSLTRIVFATIGVLVLLIGRDRRRALAFTLVVAGGAVLDVALKSIVGRPRPALLPHLDHVTSASFPSGHAANGAILYVSLALLVPPRHRRAAVAIAVVLVLAIGLSRVVLAVHWPTDVLAGWCFGLGWVLFWRHGLARSDSG